MEIIQFAFYGQEPEDVSELVYESLHGYLIPACSLPWVEVIFAPEHPAYQAYDKMYDIKVRITNRLGRGREDRDLEEMVDYMMEYSKSISLEMFRYGRKFQDMLHSEQ